MRAPQVDPEAILTALLAKRVQFVVVGGVSAILQGVPLTTFDLDIVHSRSPANISSLLAALQSLDAFYRESASRKLRPNFKYLRSDGHHLLMTRRGPLDVLGTVGKGRTYSALAAESQWCELGGGLAVRVLALPALIRLKEETARDKDRAVLQLLRRTLQEKTARESRPP